MDDQAGHTKAHSHSHSVFATLHRKKDSNNSALAKAQENREAAAREAKQYLLQVVRNDWSYDSAPPATTVGVAAETTSDPILGSENPNNVREWRIREQDTSDSERESANGKRSGPDPYRFESPESIEPILCERRRKRRKLIEEQAEWNDGLRIWIQRRNAWTGAKATLSSSPSTEVNLDSEAVRGSTSSDETGGGSYDGSCGTDMLDAGSQCLSRCTSAQKTATPAMDTSDTIRSTASTAPTNPGISDEPLIPVLKPMISDENLLRASITPSVYPAIYSRLVIQSHAPAVPINLAHMTRALVQGWKADGEWPPKPTIARDVPVVKKHMKNKSSVTESNGTKKSGVTGVSNAVKKVLGLSSFNPGHRIHVRTSSRNGSITRATEDGGANA